MTHVADLRPHTQGRGPFRLPGTRPPRSSPWGRLECKDRAASSRFLASTCPSLGYTHRPHHPGPQTLGALSPHLLV